MTRERITRALLRVYPTHTRASIGAEMVGTVLDSSDRSRRMFARECSALVIAGVRARAGAHASEKPLRQLIDGYVLAGQILLGLVLCHVTAQFLRQPSRPPTGQFVFVLALWPILGLSLIGLRRTAGMTATTWLVCLILIFGQAHVNVAVSLLIPLTSCLAMAVSQRNSSPDLRRLMWLVPILILCVGPYGHEPPLGGVPIDALILGSALAIAIFPINPRLLVACAVVWTAIALMPVLVYLPPQSAAALVLSAPVALLATTGRAAVSAYSSSSTDARTSRRRRRRKPRRGP